MKEWKDGKPPLAPIREREKKEPIWIHVGDAMEEFDGWWFAVAAETQIVVLRKIAAPLAKITELKEQMDGMEDVVTDKDMDLLMKAIAQTDNALSNLCEGLALVIDDWNFVDEKTGKPLPVPRGNPEIILNLKETSLIVAMGGMVMAYMEGTPPESLPLSSERQESGSQANED